MTCQATVHLKYAGHLKHYRERKIGKKAVAKWYRNSRLIFQAYPVLQPRPIGLTSKLHYGQMFEWLTEITSYCFGKCNHKYTPKTSFNSRIKFKREKRKKLRALPVHTTKVNRTNPTRAIDTVAVISWQYFPNKDKTNVRSNCTSLLKTAENSDTKQLFCTVGIILLYNQPVAWRKISPIDGIFGRGIFGQSTVGQGLESRLTRWMQDHASSRSKCCGKG